MEKQKEGAVLTGGQHTEDNSCKEQRQTLSETVVSEGGEMGQWVRALDKKQET